MSGQVRILGFIATCAVLLLAVGCAERRPAEVSPAGSETARRVHASPPDGVFAPPPLLESETSLPKIPDSAADADSVMGVNIRANQDPAGTANQAETTIAVNPTNPLNLIGGSISESASSQTNRFYSSLDGGQTWIDGDLSEPTYNHQYDPSVTFCADGSAYYESMSSATGTAIFVYKSINGGTTWPTRSTVVDRPFSIPFPDKPWITCDTTGSAFANRLYVEYIEKQSVDAGHVVKLKYSTSGGVSWSPEVIVSDAPALQNGGQVAIGPTGQVYLAWTKATSSSDPDHGVKLFDRSTNGGANFGADIVIHDYVLANRPEREGNPSMDVDRTSGVHRGTIYFAWTDTRTGDADILFTRSIDGGSTWSAPIRVDDDPTGNGAQQFHPAMVVDPKRRVIVTFDDNRHQIGARLYERWGAISRDGGVTFDTNFVISDVAFDGSLGFIGDYDAVTATADRIHSIWADSRSGIVNDFDAYTDRFPNIFDYDEVKGLVWLDSSNLDFQPQDVRFGVDLDYDVVSGFLSELRADGGFGRATCAASRWPAPPFVDSREPASGDGYYYLIRSHGPAGVGTYGDATPLSRTNVRDPLDESLATCP